MQTENQNTSSATDNQTTMRVLSADKKSQSKVSENNQNALFNLLDEANPDSYQKIMHDILESYLVSDLYACDEQAGRQSNYCVMQSIVKFFETLKPSGAE